MEKLVDFIIHPTGDVSNHFLSRGIFTFHNAAKYVQSLDYGRNVDKSNLLTVFSDNRGTCSTKHALLKCLADENGFEDITLFIGIFKMNGSNTPKIKERLLKYNIPYIPEAHTYLKYEAQYFDFTKIGASPEDFLNDLMHEIEIQSNQINVQKVEIHKSFLRNWLRVNSDNKYSIEEIWNIREECIKDLSE